MAWRSASIPLLLLFLLVLLLPADEPASGAGIVLAHAEQSGTDTKDEVTVADDEDDEPVDDDDDDDDSDEDADFDEDDEDADDTQTADAPDTDKPVVIDPEGQENASGYVAPDASAASFFDDFQSGFGKWVHTSEGEYSGKFAIGQGAKPVFPGDRGMIIPEKARKYGISANVAGFESMDKKDLVVMYEVRLDQGMTCGGAYVKLPTTGFKPASFNGDTKYSIMFGPDKCGQTDKVHFIFQSKNPITGEMMEHHLKNPPTVANSYDKKTHHYALHVTSDGKYTVYVDGEKKNDGSLSEDFEPPVQPPKEVEDPEDKKPEDWVDQAKIPDPDATKPDDWDEDAPKEILDEDAEKPEGWLDDEPTVVPDPKATKPAEWDDDEDGDWEAPTIANPKCEAVGCGEWKRPMKANPDYKGKWTAPMIDNPAYKGVWKPRKIPNKDFYEVKVPQLLPVLGLGVEVWTMDQGVVFDNMWMGSSWDDAKKYLDETFKAKQKAELAVEEEENAKRKKEAKEKKAKEPKSDTKLGAVMEKVEDIVEKIEKVLEPVEEYLVKMGLEPALDKMIDLGIKKPMLVVVSVPLVMVLFFLMILGGSKSTPAPASDVAEKKKTDAATPDDESKADEPKAEVKDVSESTSTDAPSEKSGLRRRTATAE